MRTTVPGRQGSSAHEILKIIESPLTWTVQCPRTEVVYLRAHRSVYLRVDLMTMGRQAGLSMHDMRSCCPQEVPRVHKLAMCGSVRWNYSIPSLCKRTSVQDKNLFSSNILRSLWGAAGGTCEAGDQMLGMQDKCARKMPPCCWFVHYRSERETWKD